MVKEYIVLFNGAIKFRLESREIIASFGDKLFLTSEEAACCGPHIQEVYRAKPKIERKVILVEPVLDEEVESKELLEEVPEEKPVEESEPKKKRKPRKRKSNKEPK